MKSLMKKRIEWNREEEMKKGSSRDENSRKQRA